MAATTVLGIESSCDETSAAVVRLEGDVPRVLSCVTAGQDALHETYRGVVPEIASRAHLESILPVVRRALAESETPLGSLDGVAAGHRPGLIGSLLVGTSLAKSLAWARGLPFVGVDHVVAHLTATLLDRATVAWPAIGLVASGGHTSLFLMRDPLTLELLGATIDDAAGEAFDKAAAILGLGYPGGARVDHAAESGNAECLDLPISRLKGLDFSFSGVKTALALAARVDPSPHSREDLAAAFRRAVIGQITRNLAVAIETHSAPTCLIGGGVAANRLLRSDAAALCERHGCELRIAEPRWCTDNAAMIAGLGAIRIARGERDPWDLAPQPMSAIARGARGPKRAAL